MQQEGKHLFEMDFQDFSVKYNVKNGTNKKEEAKKLMYDFCIAFK
ncbi:hypothetical protein FM107_12300 [Sphingobacterium sp. JB170]|nr:hypothetical protein FM107_12300 [Sphingobacterium sp. JB170]